MKAQNILTFGIVITFFSVPLVLPDLARAHANPSIKLELLDVKKVWDKAPHNAFTDLVCFKDKLFLTFREAFNHHHQSPCGDIRVLSSQGGDNWESTALIEYGTDADDLRDSKLSVTPEGKLLLVCALAPKENHESFQSFAYLSDDGVTWEGPHKVGEFNWWMWRVVWSPDGAAYGVGYYCGANTKERTTRLYRSKDGLNYEIFLSRFAPQNRTSEAAMLFRKDGSAVSLIRRDGLVNTAVVGIAEGDNHKWIFHELKQRIGSPQIVETPMGHIIAAGRLYDGKVRTSVGMLDPQAGSFTELLKLPSGGDTGYPGMVFHDGLLWISYYSSHEGKANIYLAKIKITE